MVDLILDEWLLVEASLIDCIFGEVGLDYLECAEVAFAKALIADAAVGVVVGKVGVFEFRGCFGEGVFFVETIVVVMFEVIVATRQCTERAIKLFGFRGLIEF